MLSRGYGYGYRVILRGPGWYLMAARHSRKVSYFLHLQSGAWPARSEDMAFTCILLDRDRVLNLLEQHREERAFLQDRGLS